MRLQELDRADIEQRAQRETHIRGVPHLQHRGRQRDGQALAAVLGLEGQRVPAAFGVFLIGLLEAGRRAHDAILEPRALAVADIVERRQHVARQLACLLENGVDEIGARLLAARELRDRGETGELVERETHVGEGRRVGDHRDGSSGADLLAIAPSL